MIPSLIFAFSIGALLQFAVSYCRTLLLTYGELPLSARVQEITGFATPRSAGSDFERLLQLLRFAPQTDADAGQLRAIRIYYSVTRVASILASPFSRKAAEWFQGEHSRCTYFAAVALDRRLAIAQK
jgi:hypothetical protein